MPNKDQDDEPPLWLTVLKLLAGAIVIIGLTGLALWYVDDLQQREPQRDPAVSAKMDWGIARDSPLRPQR